MTLVLASASPRRARLLRQIGISFKVVEPGISERISGLENPAGLVVDLAKEKASAVARRLESGFVIGADTVVFYEGRILGKPADEEEARCMLEMLSGKVHAVFTGLALYNVAGGHYETGFSKTKVWMKPLAGKYIDLYVKSGEPLDKAGAYGIQGRGAVFIDKIEGCYFNVVGLPLSLLFDLLTHMQVPTWLSRKDGGNG